MEHSQLMHSPTFPSTVAEWAAADREATGRRLRSPHFWQSLVGQGLTISEGALAPGRADRWLSEAERAGMKARPREELAEVGYTSLPGFAHQEPCAALAAGIVALARSGWHPAFITLFDETWLMAFHIAEAMAGVVDVRMAFRRELFAFCVEPTYAAGRARGVQAHRDRPDSGFTLVGDAALPRHCTCWLSLTDADEANGCMYVVPARANDRAALALPAEESERGHPLETTRGTLLAWSGQVVHWGGRYDVTRARGPRVALTLSLTHPALMSMGGLAPVTADTLPTFADRLALASSLISKLEPPGPESPLEAVLQLIREVH